MANRRTLKNILVGAFLVPLLTGFGAFTGEQFRIKYNPEVMLAYDHHREGIGLNAYTAVGGLVGLAVAAVGMTIEVRTDREKERENNKY